MPKTAPIDPEQLKARLIARTRLTPRDWRSDLKYDNGFYVHTCQMCGKVFRGAKDRKRCRDCS